jgi:hypothetical protein
VSVASAALERPARIEMSILFSVGPIGARGQGRLHQNEPYTNSEFNAALA